MRIILDMDDVLCDFRGGACRVHDKSVEELSQIYGSWWAGVSFWGPIFREQERFWSGLGRYGWFQELVNLVDGVSQGDWIIATALPDDGHCLPGLNSYCAAGKLKWIEQQFGSKFDRIHIGGKKHLYANLKTLLIDDREATCEAFRSHGGQAIVFPSPSNNYKAFKNDPISIIRDTFKMMGVL